MKSYVLIAAVVLVGALAACAQATPTLVPTRAPASVPTLVPTEAPTLGPAQVPAPTSTKVPTVAATAEPTQTQAEAPTQAPTQRPAEVAAVAPTLASQDEVQRISPEDAKALIDQGKAMLYDVRSNESYAAKHAVGAISLPENALATLSSTLPHDKDLILY